jgi:AcrR family transcriptional regulator
VASAGTHTGTQATGTRDRILDASGELFRRQGYVGTGVKQIVEAASAPFGSLYHFFPGGKEELGAQVIRSSGAMYAQLVEAVIDPEPDIAAGVAAFFAGAADTLRETDYADACPTVALEISSTSEPMREAAADVFESWISALAARLVAAGLDAGRARALAIEMIAALEGAFVLSRATRTTEALEVAGAAAVAAVHEALAAAR